MYLVFLYRVTKNDLTEEVCYILGTDLGTVTDKVKMMKQLSGIFC